ncbi:stage III sporulation protein AA [Amphibacillus marinus]|uniref:stage III sporulation protein AA n=1 Tax=Amphibacillus marinus TaxID=872970 RepID=UPI000B83A577
MLPNDILKIIPKRFHQELNSISGSRLIEEIRIRINKPIELVFQNHFNFIAEYTVTVEDGHYILNQLSEFSRYRLEEELRQGYVTLAGGHRVGIAGQTVVQNQSVKQIQTISSFNIRLAREKIGVANTAIKYLFESGQYLNTLIIGPPQSGKTTYLRDLARIIATGWGQTPAYKVGIVDERSEIAACKGGQSQYQLGDRYDVLDHCPKSEGMMMLIRSMSPDVLIVDEIGSERDVQAILEASRAGVAVLCTAHSMNLTQLKKRSQFQYLLKENYFDRFIILNRTNRTSIQVLNENGENIALKRGERHELDWSDFANYSNVINRL